jgi:hypothetical protein
VSRDKYNTTDPYKVLWMYVLLHTIYYSKLILLYLAVKCDFYWKFIEFTFLFLSLIYVTVLSNRYIVPVKTP